MPKHTTVTIYAVAMLLLLPGFIWSQSRLTDDMQVRVSYRTGAVMPEYSLFTYLADEYIQSFEVAVSKGSFGRSEWNQLFSYPEYGLAFQYASLGNRDVFGHAISVYPFFNVQLFRAGHFSMLNKTGLGVGIVNKIFDPVENPANVAMGSHLNLHFNFELAAQYQLHSRLAMLAGITLDHLSNGNLAEPNLGINYITLHGSMKYRIGEARERIRHELRPHTPQTETSLIGAFGIKHARALQGRKFMASSLSFEWKRKWWRTFTPGIGADLFYDTSTPAEMAAFTETSHRGIHNFKTGIHLTQELVYGKFSVALQEGLYLGLTDKAFDNRMYNRLIIRHRAGSRYIFQIAMKSHVVVLDALEFGVGYSVRS